jgi:hypothetical protein
MGGVSDLADQQIRPDQESAPPADASPNAIHLVRTVQQVQYQLSQMADQKASILMGATFVVFTITIGQAKGGAMPSVPLMVLGGFSFLAAVLAILAVLPATGPQKGKHNLLFFGSFSRMSQEDYLDQFLASLDDDAAIFRAMATDIYQNGRVLGRKKYRLLGYGYRVFLAGLTASMLTFVWQNFL